MLKALPGHRREQIALQKANAVGNAIQLGVFARDDQRGRREVDGGHLRMRQFMGQRDGNRARAGADIHNARRCKARGQFERLLDRVLGLRARNQHVARDLEGQPVKLAFRP